MLKHLPPRLTVPPLPPQLHRRLRVRVIDDGLLLYPGTNSEPEDAVLIRYGIKAKVEAFAVPPADESLEGEVELGGVVGIVRLWDGESRSSGQADLSRVPRRLSARKEAADKHLPWR